MGKRVFRWVFGAHRAGATCIWRLNLVTQWNCLFVAHIPLGMDKNNTICHTLMTAHSRHVYTFFNSHNWAGNSFDIWTWTICTICDIHICTNRLYIYMGRYMYIYIYFNSDIGRGTIERIGTDDGRNSNERAIEASGSLGSMGSVSSMSNRWESREESHLLLGFSPLWFFRFSWSPSANVNKTKGASQREGSEMKGQRRRR